MILTALFLLFFVGGPLIFRSVTRVKPSRQGLRRLGFATAFLAAGGIGLRYGFPQRWGQDVWFTGAGILLIWFAWIGVLAFGAQTLRRNDGGLRMRRWTGVIGALGTTMPWFGLASANLVGV